MRRSYDKTFVMRLEPSILVSVDAQLYTAVLPCALALKTLNAHESVPPAPPEGAVKRYGRKAAASVARLARRLGLHRLAGRCQTLSWPPPRPGSMIESVTLVSGEARTEFLLVHGHGVPTVSMQSGNGLMLGKVGHKDDRVEVVVRYNHADRWEGYIRSVMLS